MSLPLMRGFSANRLFPVLKNTFPKLRYSLESSSAQEIVPDYTKIENEMSKAVFEKVNQQIANKSHGRLFAVIQIFTQQFKITTEDLIVIKGAWPPTISDKLRLEKVLLVGCSDFTLIGRPLLPFDQVTVIATVIEKKLSHTIPWLRYRPRKKDTKLKFCKEELTYLRINSITLTGKVNELGDTDGFNNRIF